MIPLTKNNTSLTIKMTDCKRKRMGGGLHFYDMLWLQQQGFMQLKRWDNFLLCWEDDGRPLVAGFAAVFWGTGEKSHKDFCGGEQGGARWVKSHLEARDGAEFREQHLEFQLYHVGQTHNEPRQGEVGDGSWFDLFNWEFFFSAGVFGVVFLLCRFSHISLFVHDVSFASPWPAHKPDIQLWVTIRCFLSSPADSAEWKKKRKKKEFRLSIILSRSPLLSPLFLSV